MSKQKSMAAVPDGIILGSKVVIVPSVSGSFARGCQMDSEHMYVYAWINRGEPIGSLSIDLHKINIPILQHFFAPDTQTAVIPSPVSGLLIQSRYDFQTRDSVAILIPDDEPAAENGDYMFSELCGLLSRNSNYFINPPSGRSHRAWTAKEFDSEIECQISSQCKYIDALPTYGQYVEDIRKTHPELRNCVRHLQ